MRVLAGLSLVLWSLASAPSFADHPSAATRSDVRQLRSELELLDERLALVEDTHPRAGEFRRRESEIREDVVALRTQIRQHEQNRRSGLGASKSEVDTLRAEIVDLRADIDDALGNTRRDDYTGTRLPDGTEIDVRLEDTLSSKTARPEDRVVATLADSIRQDGRIAIPAGTELRGVVSDVERARRPARGGRLGLTFDTLVVNGRQVPIAARVVDVKESSIDKSKAGLGALLGGVIGAVVDGKKGALIGAVVGGAGAVVATRGDEVVLPAGTVVTLRLDRPLSLARR